VKLLFVSSWFPYPPDNGSRVRQYHLLRRLARNHEITLLSLLPEAERQEHIPSLEAICRKVQVVPARPYKPRGPRALLGFFSPYPRVIVDTYNPQMAHLVQAETEAEAYDLCLASETAAALYAPHAQVPVRVFDDPELCNLMSKLDPSTPSLIRWRHRLTWVKTKRFVCNLLQHFDACAVVSEQERTHIKKLAPSSLPTELVPNGVDLAHYRSWTEERTPHSLVFSGSLIYQANYDAVAHFLQDTLPIIHHQMPEVTLHVTGRLDGVSLNGLSSSHQVIFVGYVDDVRPYVGGSRVCVVPLREGGGTRLKILEAMALGTPVVSTGKGAEGLEVTAGQNILIADEPAAFANAVVQVLRDERLATKLAIEGRRLVEEHYGWDAIVDRLERLMAKLITDHRQAPQNQFPHGSRQMADHGRRGL
jgi:glycosyltransferase involved in cell wall biosynthesis